MPKEGRRKVDRSPTDRTYRPPVSGPKGRSGRRGWYGEPTRSGRSRRPRRRHCPGRVEEERRGSEKPKKQKNDDERKNKLRIRRRRFLFPRCFSRLPTCLSLPPSQNRNDEEGPQTRRCVRPNVGAAAPTLPDVVRTTTPKAERIKAKSETHVGAGRGRRVGERTSYSNS